MVRDDIEADEEVFRCLFEGESSCNGSMKGGPHKVSAEALLGGESWLSGTAAAAGQDGRSLLDSTEYEQLSQLTVGRSWTRCAEGTPTLAAGGRACSSRWSEQH